MSALDKHTARPSFDGYLYQLQVALLRLLQLEEGEALGIEKLDDVHTEDPAGVATNVTQVKYHDGQAVVGDLSPDLWKTVGIWSQGILSGELNVLRTQFTLLTTATLPAGGIAEALARHDHPASVETKMLAACTRSKNRELQPYMGAFVSLPQSDRLELIARIAIEPNQPGFSGTLSELKRVLRNGFRADSLSTAVERICGWLYVQVLERRAGACIIRREDFEIALATIRDDMKSGSIPARFADSRPSPEEMAGQSSRIYVQQLKAVNVRPRATTSAIIDYFRTVHERNEWIRRGNVLPDELRQYDNELAYRWQKAFERMLDALDGAEPTESLKQDKGRQLLEQLEALDIPIRPGWLGQYLTQGTLHKLADTPEIGWHPDWRRLFAEDGKEKP